MLRDRGQGPTLIVSPLLALMRNQRAAAERSGIRAPSINSTNRSEWPALQEEILGDQADALLISPERLANDRADAEKDKWEVCRNMTFYEFFLQGSIF